MPVLLSFSRELFVNSARFIELREHVAFFSIRSPPGPLIRHLVKLVDPSDEVFGRVTIANWPVSHVYPDGVGSGLGISRIQIFTGGAFGIKRIPSALRDANLLREVSARGELLYDLDPRSGMRVVDVGRKLRLNGLNH